MNYDEAAEYLGVKKSTLRRWVRQRLLPVVRYGYRTHRFNRTDLDSFRDAVRGLSSVQSVVCNVCRICFGRLLGCHVHGLEIMTLASPPLSLLTLPGYCRFTWFPAQGGGVFLGRG